MEQLSFAEVGEILGLVNQMDCASFTLEHGDLKIDVQRTPSALPVDEHAAGQPEPVVERPPTATAPVAESQSQTSAPERQDDTGGWQAVTAPMAGTFYRSPEPGQSPWVSVGDRVEAGQTVGVLEVMKLFTELKVEQAGAVTRIDAEDGALAEYGQPLVWIEPQ